MYLKGYSKSLVVLTERAVERLAPPKSLSNNFSRGEIPAGPGGGAHDIGVPSRLSRRNEDTRMHSRNHKSLRLAGNHTRLVGFQISIV